MDNIYDEINRMKINLESSVKNNKKTDVNYDNFKKKYKIGLVSDEQLKSSFHNADKLTFDECMRVAQTSGVLCDPQNDIKYCPYIAYEDTTQNCYIGGIKNDMIKFDNTSGIPVYPTPLAGTEDIKDREKRTIENIKIRLETKKEQILGELEKQIYDTKVYLKYAEKSSQKNLQLKISQNSVEVIGLGYVVSSEAKSGNNSLIIILAVAIGVLILINLLWFLFLRKRIKK